MRLFSRDLRCRTLGGLPKQFRPSPLGARHKLRRRFVRSGDKASDRVSSATLHKDR